MLRRIVVLFALLAVATVPLARAQDPGTDTAATTPVATLGETTPATTDPAATTTTTTTTPATPGVIPEGVTIQGLSVGGMSSTDATAAVQAAFDEPLQFSYKERDWWATPDRLGARAYVAGAVQRALTSAPGSAVELVVTIKGSKLDEYVAFLNRNFGRAAKDSTLRLVNYRPRISEPRDGFDIKEPAMKASIVRALKSGERGPVRLEGKILKAKVTQKGFGPVIVIRRESRKLFLYRGEKLWRQFAVGVGMPEYPTPLGNFEIVVKQRDPWWYPPPGSEWAADAKPIPPGPGNPLGTRWMGLSAPLIGIHGTPDSASVGYSASHGCIRMLVPEAEWMFERVELGTPVFIVRA